MNLSLNHQLNNNISNNQINSGNISSNNIVTNKYIDNPIEESHAKALDDFKKLLAKIDEKLDNI
jgi:predicted nucleotide-binding protein (sugar kinase/HSP70/actin superfamily)